MKAFADLHSHCTYSDGRGTVAENIQAAAAKGLSEYALTDHGPANIGTGVKNEGKYREIQAQVAVHRSEFPELEIKVGAEADIIGLNGEIDLSPEIISDLDLLIIGLHPYIRPRTLKDAWKFVLGNQVHMLGSSRAGGLNRDAPGLARRVEDRIRVQNTKALIEAMARHQPDIISHPNLGMPVDIAEIARACARFNCAYEINTGHHFQTIADVETAAREGATFVVNSDAHFPETIGTLDFGIELLERAGVDAEQTLNLL